MPGLTNSHCGRFLSSFHLWACTTVSHTAERMPDELCLLFDGQPSLWLADNGWRTERGAPVSAFVCTLACMVSPARCCGAARLCTRRGARGTLVYSVSDLACMAALRAAV